MLAAPGAPVAVASREESHVCPVNAWLCCGPQKRTVSHISNRFQFGNVAVGTGKTLENYRYENDRLRQTLRQNEQDAKDAQREQRRLVTENNRFRECLKHSEREKRDLVAQIRAMASYLASSRQQELQKAEPVALKRMPHGSATRKPLRPRN